MKNRVLLDFHSHILPGMDDGAQHPKESLAMLRAEKKAGITDVCLTSHFYAEENSLSTYITRRQNAFDLLRRECRDSHDSVPNLHLSAEVHYYESLADEPLLSLLCCGASNLILIEPPMREWGESFFANLRRIQHEQDLQPVIAHLDRYLCVLEDFSLLSQVMEYGFLIQCNIEFFLDEFYSSTALRMLDSGNIMFVGSDAHNLTNRPVEMRAFVQQMKKHKLMEKFYSISANGVRLLQGSKQNSNIMEE